MKYLLILILLGLTACTSAPRVTETIPQPEEQPQLKDAEPQVAHVESPPIGSLKYKILEAANAEWIYFGQQIVVIDGDTESIPQIGIWEDENDQHSKRINLYWRAVGKNKVTGYDCKEPWSAAFISWVMQTAGAPKGQFPPSGSHRFYLNHFLAHAGNPQMSLIPHLIGQYKPKPGDLICATRSKSKPQSALDELPDSLKGGLHCDIVVEVNDKNMHMIGGNVRNSVSKTITPLSSDGHVQLSSKRSWFLIIENRLD